MTKETDSSIGTLRRTECRSARPVSAFRFSNARMGRRAILFGTVHLSACILLLMLCLPIRAAQKSKMIVHPSEHYTIETDLGQKAAAGIAKNMEAIRAEYIRRLSWLKGTLPGKFRVVVYKTREDYLDALGAEFQNTGGVYIPNRKMLASFLGDREPSDVLHTLYHEGFHQFISYYITSGTPVWVNEGLAQYFEYSTWIGKKFAVGEAPPTLVGTVKEMVNRDDCIPLAELFGMSYEDWARNLVGSRTAAQKQYAQAWSVVYFLVKAKGGKYEPKLVSYLKALDRGTSFGRAAEEAFGSDLSSLEKAWKAYVRTDLAPSAKYACIENLHIIGFMLTKFEVARTASSPDQLFERLLNTKGWFVSAGERRVSPDDPESVVNLFVCPNDLQGKARKKSSYTFVKVQGATVPAIACPYHRGFTLIARPVFDPNTGNYEFEIDEKPTSAQ